MKPPKDQPAGLSRGQGGGSPIPQIAGPGLCRHHEERLGVLEGYGCFYEFGVLFDDALIIRALLFGVYISAPDLGNLPYATCPLFLGITSTPSLSW